MPSTIDIHLPEWLRRAMRSPAPTRVDFAGSRYISVFPALHRYASNIQDWAATSLRTSDVTGFTALPAPAAELASQPLGHLHWQLALQNADHLLRDKTFQLSMVRLVAWPSLTQLPQEVVPAVARLCALLARKPTTVFLLPQLLELPEVQVARMIQVLQLDGCTQLSGMAAAPAADTPAAVPHEGVRPAAPSLIGKIWQRLLARS